MNILGYLLWVQCLLKRNFLIFNGVQYDFYFDVYKLNMKRTFNKFDGNLIRGKTKDCDET